MLIKMFQNSMDLGTNFFCYKLFIYSSLQKINMIVTTIKNKTMNLCDLYNNLYIICIIQIAKIMYISHQQHHNSKWTQDVITGEIIIIYRKYTNLNTYQMNSKA